MGGVVFLHHPGGQIRPVADEAGDAHLQILLHLIRIVYRPHVDRQAQLPGLGHQAVAHQALLHRQEVDVVLPDGLVQIPGAGVGAVAHPPLRVGLVDGGEAGVVQGHEDGPLPEVMGLHHLQDGPGQGLPLAGLRLELDEQAHAALIGLAEPDELLQGGDVSGVLIAGGVVEGQGAQLLPGQGGHALHPPRQPQEAPVVEGHGHAVGGKLDVHLRVVGPHVRRRLHRRQGVLHAVDAAPVAHDDGGVEQRRLVAVDDQVAGQQGAHRSGHGLPAPFGPAGPDSRLEAGPPLRPDGQDGAAVLAPRRLRRNRQVLPGQDPGQNQIEEGGHQHGVEQRGDQPVEQIDAEGLGVDQIFQEKPVKVPGLQHVAPPVPGQLRVGLHPQEESSRQHRQPLPAHAPQAAHAAPGRLPEPLPPQGHKNGDEEQQEVGPVIGGVDGDDPRRADGGVDHLPQDEPGNGDGGHQGVEVHRLGQGEEEQIVQGARHHRPALHGTQGPQGLLHHPAHGDLLPLAGEGHQADDHAQLIEGQQPGGEEQGQEDQCALQVQEGAQHIRVEGDPHRRHIGLVDLPQQRADDHQGHQLPQQFEFQHAPHGVSQLHTRHLTTQNPNTNHSTFWKVMQEARGRPAAAGNGARQNPENDP